MGLSDRQVRLLEVGVHMAVPAVIAAVQAAGEDGEPDWNSVRITKTPEMALEEARQRKLAE